MILLFTSTSWTIVDASYRRNHAVDTDCFYHNLLFGLIRISSLLQNKSIFHYCIMFLKTLKWGMKNQSEENTLTDKTRTTSQSDANQRNQDQVDLKRRNRQKRNGQIDEWYAMTRQDWGQKVFPREKLRVICYLFEMKSEFLDGPALGSDSSTGITSWRSHRCASSLPQHLTSFQYSSCSRN